MHNNEPFVHLIKTPYGHYAFDVNTNNIIGVNESIFNALTKMTGKNAGDKTEVDENTQTMLTKMMQEGLFSSNRAKKMEYPGLDNLGYRLNNNIRKITLQITQQCNFRCSYCIYGESDTKQRNHSSKKMSFDTVKKGIDFLINHSRDQETINIGFYGGEPLLEFELIKSAVEYAEEFLGGKDITYSLTTNGSLLNDEIVEYFIKHNVMIMISLDGPQEIHDKNRRFSSNNCGTFNIIEKNLIKIKDKYPEFFKKISFSVVIDPRNDFNCINNMFVNYDLFKEANTQATLVDSSYSDEKTPITEDYIVKANYEIFKAFLYKFNRIEKEKVSPITLNTVTRIFSLTNKFGKMFKIPEVASHGGPCIPGELRLFVNADGYFYPCERVSEVSEVMRIGHLDTGFDIEKAKKLLNICSLTASSCLNCWSIMNCTLCARSADNIKDFSADLIRSNCRQVKESNDEQFRDYIMFDEIKTHYADLIG